MENSKREFIVAANWKMNMTYEQGRDLAKAIVNRLQPSAVKVVLGVPFIHLKNLSGTIKDISNLYLGAQNCHQQSSGAYTGEISAAMLKSCDVDYVILGHSERREYFGESDELVGEKIKTVLEQGMKVIYCCGEKLEVREADGHKALVGEQLKTAFAGLDEAAMKQMVIAYEPVWAIGTGKTASPEQAQEMHAHIRTILNDLYGDNIAQSTAILYGGSVKASNAKELFSQPDVDGGLIGGASLNAEEFIAIVESR
ncbi:MAG TPA: triose-phosphate isomerase [Saprospiraceae bacterium]|nr:triose-phosphate isomerase [Saprospiraceae bacterium]HMQ85145.1 triose-phosphate isomerase [Saprospiraceae bacterium]